MLLKDVYKFSRLIFINSANHAYTELPIDRHTLLVGANNVGKTSSLSALKLFLLPEVNFKDCPTKFRFKGKEGYYDALDSFQHYFPCGQSLIILDAENPHGPFCVILSRGAAELGYVRTFVPRPYDAIRHLFWESAAEGTGGPMAAMSRDGLKSALKGEDSVHVSDTDTLKTTIYQENALDPRLGRFCLAPLPDGGSRQEIEALRALVQLLFDNSDGKGQSLPRAIATIIEGERQTAGERLAVDFDAIIAEHAALYADLQRLHNLEENIPLWKTLDESCGAYAGMWTQAARLFAGIRTGIDAANAALAPQIEEWEATQRLMNEEHAYLDEQRTDAHAMYNQHLGSENSLRKRIKHLQQDVDGAEKVLQEYGGSTEASVIVEILQEQCAEHQKNIDAANSEEAARQQLTGYLSEKNGIMRALSHAQRTHEGGDVTLVELSAPTASVLKSLNQSFARCRAGLSTEQRAVVESFAGQFSPMGGDLAWNGQPLPGATYLPYDPALEKERLEREIHDYEKQLIKLDRLIETLNKSLKFSATQKVDYVSEQQKAMQRAERDVQLIIAYPQRKKDLAAAQTELKGQEMATSAAKVALDALVQQLEEAAGRRTEAKIRVDDFRSQQKDLARLMEAVTSTGAYAHEGMLAGAEGIKPVPAASLNDAVNHYRALCAEVAATHTKAISALRQLIRHKLIDDISITEADRDDIDFVELRRYRERFGVEFQNLGGLKANHENRVFEHNKSTNNMVAELKANAARIQSFEKEINAELHVHRISNLTEISIKIGLDPRFVDLQSKIEGRQSSASETELAGADFYNDLGSFARDFFTKRGQRTILNLQDVIARVDFAFSRDKVVDKKGQSNGTTSMFFAILLSTLFDRLIAGGNQLQMPLVMDEVASLDADNLRILIAVTEKHGFRLFSATPELSGLLASVIGNWIALGRLRMTNPLAPECTCVWTEDHEELQPLTGTEVA
jgi:hypothetical protein